LVFSHFSSAPKKRLNSFKKASALLGDNEIGDGPSDGRALGPGQRTVLSVASAERYSNNPWQEHFSEDPGIDLARYWRILLKHRWLILASIVGALAIGLAITLLMTPIYQADTTLKIDREVARIVDVEGVEAGEQSGATDEFFQTQYGLLKSRTLTMNVVDRLGLATNDTFFETMGVTPPARAADGSVTERRRAAIGIVQRNLGVNPIRGSRLVKVSFSSPNPQLAANIANAIAEEYIATNLNRRYESSDYARQFLEGKLADAKAKLEASEQAAADYAKQERLINVAPVTADAKTSSTQSLAVTSLVALNSALSTARGERIRAEERWRQSQGAAVVSLPEVIGNPTVQELAQTKAKLESEYQDKRNIFKPDFPEMVALRARIDEMDRQIQREMQNIQASLKINYDIARRQEASFEQQVQQLQGATLDVGQRSIRYGILERESDTNRTLYDGLLQRYKEIGVAGGVSTNNVSIVDRAEPPAGPSKPKPLLNMLLAGFVGLGIGIVLALMLELLDEFVSSPEDMEGKLGIALLGSVPKLAKGESPAASLSDRRSAFSEAYYSIRTALQFSTAQGAPASLLITSSRPSEGKSTTAFAIAQNFARIGIRVLLVDGDLRNPSMHRYMGMDNGQGLSNILTGSLSIEHGARDTDTPNLQFIACGPLPPNPAELLAGGSWAKFLKEALLQYSMVVVDGPPVLGLADAPTLAASIDGTVFVVESRGTRRGLARTAIQRLHLGHARIIGGVLTKFDAKRAAYGYGADYAYAYEYSYGDKPKLNKPS
jgi:polysaccharide biosynthesis transport protein